MAHTCDMSAVADTWHAGLQVQGIADHVGVGIHFNTLVPVEGQVRQLAVPWGLWCPPPKISPVVFSSPPHPLPPTPAWWRQIIKYGVMGLQPLLDDLNTWRHLYVAGRLHKPGGWRAQCRAMMAAVQGYDGGSAGPR